MGYKILKTDIKNFGNFLLKSFITRWGYPCLARVRQPAPRPPPIPHQPARI